MKQFALLAAVLTASCSPQTRSDVWALATNTYDHGELPALCFQLDQIDWRAEQHCPEQAQAHEVALRVYDLATMPVGWTVVFQAELGGDTQGKAEPYSKTAFVADVEDPMAVAAHELLHAALFELTGDLDEKHLDPRWGQL